MEDLTYAYLSPLDNAEFTQNHEASDATNAKSRKRGSASWCSWLCSTEDHAKGNEASTAKPLWLQSDYLEEPSARLEEVRLLQGPAKCAPILASSPTKSKAVNEPGELSPTSVVDGQALPPPLRKKLPPRVYDSTTPQHFGIGFDMHHTAYW